MLTPPETPLFDQLWGWLAAHPRKDFGIRNYALGIGATALCLRWGSYLSTLLDYTKAGHRDLRTTLVEAAQTASNTHPHWKAELARLEPRLGRNKAIVAIARKLLVAVWHVLINAEADRFAEPEIVARKFMQYAWSLGKANRPTGQTAGQYVRQQLDNLGIGAELKAIPWGSKKAPIALPPSTLTLEKK